MKNYRENFCKCSYYNFGFGLIIFLLKFALFFQYVPVNLVDLS